MRDIKLATDIFNEIVVVCCPGRMKATCKTFASVYEFIIILTGSLQLPTLW